MRDSDWEIIVALHKTGSITKTAELLFLSQPALTKRIQTIEAELGIPLLVRTRHGSAFTPEGERVAQRAERVCEAIRAVRSDASEMNTGVKQTLRVGVPYSFVRYVLPDILKRFTGMCPNAEVEILTMPSQQLVKAVEDSLADLCFARYNAEESSLERSLFSEDQAYIVCSSPFEIEQLPQIPYVDYYKNPGTESAVLRWWNERFPAVPDVRYRVTTADACLSLIRSGLGYGVFMDQRYFQEEDELHRRPLVYLDGTPLTRKTFIFYRKENRKDRLVNLFIRAARENGQD